MPLLLRNGLYVCYLVVCLVLVLSIRIDIQKRSQREGGSHFVKLFSFSPTGESCLIKKKRFKKGAHGHPRTSTRYAPDIGLV